MTAPPRVPHWRDLALGPGGRSLVEASAGTGKTWTIGVLWWRLLLEPDQPPGVRGIVVTTFTEAAAQELRERLRARLQQALHLAAAPPLPQATLSEDEAWLCGRWEDPARHAEDLRRLRLALADFDRAPIGTLHGLCQRILAEHPVAAGEGVQPRELASGNALLEELANDAWRVLQQSDDDALAAAGLQDMTLGAFTRRLGELMRPGVRLAPAETFEQARDALAPTLLAPLRGLVGDASWFVRSNAKLRAVLTELADWLEGGEWKEAGKRLKVLHDFELAGQVKPGRETEFMQTQAVVALLDGIPRLVCSLGGREAGFWATQLGRVTRWRDERLAARSQVTFDEMIRRAHDALRTRPVLADALFADWPFALVDEFQDTDDQQYGILDRIYRDAEGGKRGRLVMIGDPKQAIYGFRGGDVQAYLRAKRDADEMLSLDTNHRSARHYVGAVNALFAAAGAALDARGEGAIEYEAVKASGRPDETPLCHRGQPAQAPLVLHYLADAPESQPERRRAALLACADQIAAMLADAEATLDRRRPDGSVERTRLRPGDLAVLLPTNPDITRLREELQRRGVPCAGAGRASVFSSEWAFELQVVLQALANPGDEGAARAALLTRLLGASLEDIARFEHDAIAREAAGDQLQALHLAWRERGVLAVVLQLCARAAPRLLATASGERDLTDLRHLGELLQQQADGGLGPRALLAWLAAQRQDQDGQAADAEERLLRIESDARRVQLMTLHGAKGLEFPVVFLPLMWKHELVEKHFQPPFLLPEHGVPGRVARFDPAAREQARHESQDERFRVLYVALTRAIHACHVYALPPSRPSRKGGKTPLADPVRSPLDALLDRLGVEGAAPDLPHLLWQADWPMTGATATPPASTPAPRQALPMPAPALLRQRLSFSSLVGGSRVGEEEDAATDEREATEPAPMEEAEPAHPGLLALQAVRGPAFGNAVHASFELRAHDRPLAGQTGLLAAQLAAFGVRARGVALDSLLEPLARQLDASLQAELAPGLRLGGVPAGEQRAEIAFHFALDGARTAALREACAAHGEAGLVPPLPWTALRGLMTGKIDLVFRHEGRVHVLDYKGNWLGERLADYQGEALARAMDDGRYRLQALLYTLAVHRYLAQRLPDYSPEEHLGDAIYLFVRAAGLAPGAGVWRRRFTPALVRAVDAVFARVEGEESGA